MALVRDRFDRQRRRHLDPPPSRRESLSRPAEGAHPDDLAGNVREAAEADLRRFVENEAADFPAVDAIWKALRTRGKLLGPPCDFAWGMLPLLICGELGMAPLRALPLSTATECFIAALDVLDDLEDEDAHDALWRSCGRATATNVATLLLFLYQRALASLVDLCHDPSLVSAVQRIYATAGIRACGGQQQDLDGYAQDEDQYLGMVARKTGSLTQGICRAAARLATSDQTVIDRYAELGLNLGIAMQIANDVAAIAIEKDRNDLMRGKKELSLLFALASAPPEQRGWLEALLERARASKIDPPDVGRIRGMLQAMGAFHYALLVADVYWERTLAALGAGPLRGLIETMRGWEAEQTAGEINAG